MEGIFYLILESFVVSVYASLFESYIHKFVDLVLIFANTISILEVSIYEPLCVYVITKDFFKSQIKLHYISSSENMIDMSDFA